MLRHNDGDFREFFGRRGAVRGQARCEWVQRHLLKILGSGGFKGFRVY